MINIHNIIIEGPDLSGKSSLFNNIHKETNYCWNIQDRSDLSMICYSRLYNRGNLDFWRKRLEDFLNTINNRVIILLPPWKEIKRRYFKRGDDIQNLESLEKLYKIYKEETNKINNFSTVYVINDNAHQRDILIKSLNYLKCIKDYSIDNIVQEIQNNILVSEKNSFINSSLDLKINNISNIRKYIDNKSIYFQDWNKIYSLFKEYLVVWDENLNNNEIDWNQVSYSSFNPETGLKSMCIFNYNNIIHMKVMCNFLNVKKFLKDNIYFLCSILEELTNFLFKNKEKISYNLDINLNFSKF